jgi:F0F1-type ATP synthase membrane subunit a
VSVKRIALIVAGVYVAGIVILFAAFGSEGENEEFQPQEEFRLEPWIELKIGGLDLSINRAVFYLFLTCVLTTGAMVYVARRMQQRPNKVQTAVETLYNLTYNTITRGNMSEQMAKKWFPFVATLFFFIWISNLIGYLPLPTNTHETVDIFGIEFPSFAIYAATANLSVPLVLTLVVWLSYHIEGIMAKGLLKYLGSWIPAGLEDMKAGRGRPAEEVFEESRREFTDAIAAFYPGRVDLTDVPLVTLDPVGSRDLDQAVHVGAREANEIAIGVEQIDSHALEQDFRVVEIAVGPGMGMHAAADRAGQQLAEVVFHGVVAEVENRAEDAVLGAERFAIGRAAVVTGREYAGFAVDVGAKGYDGIVVVVDVDGDDFDGGGAEVGCHDCRSCHVRSGPCPRRADPDGRAAMVGAMTSGELAVPGWSPRPVEADGASLTYLPDHDPSVDSSPALELARGCLDPKRVCARECDQHLSRADQIS